MKKIICAILLFFCLCSLTFVFIYKHNQSISNNILIEESKTINDDDFKEDEFYDVEDVGILNGDLITMLTQKNGNWEGIPLSENFKKKFNEKDGVLGNIYYDKFEYCPYLNIVGNPLVYREHFVITTGKKEQCIYIHIKIL